MSKRRKVDAPCEARTGVCEFFEQRDLSEARKQMAIALMAAIMLARAELLKANAIGISERTRKKYIKSAHDALVVPYDDNTTITVVKLRDDEKKPVSAVCSIEGYCCFDRAYALGKADQKHFPKGRAIGLNPEEK